MKAAGLLFVALALVGCASARPRIAPGLYNVVWACGAGGCSTTLLLIGKVQRNGWAPARACVAHRGGVSCATTDTAAVNLRQALWLQQHTPATPKEHVAAGGLHP